MPGEDDTHGPVEHRLSELSVADDDNLAPDSTSSAAATGRKPHPPAATAHSRLSFYHPVVALPIETWHTIAQYLPPADRRALLFVSQFLRTVALHSLFRRVVLAFGLWENLRETYAPEYEDLDLPAAAAAQAARTRGLVEHIAADRTFARAVRELHVHAHHAEAGLAGADLARIAAALRALPHLHAFHWFGTLPPLPLAAAEALVETCVDLRDLRLPASQESHAPLRALARLRRLGSLQILCMLDVDNANGYWPSRVAECAPEMLALAAANGGLRRLAGPGALAGVLAPPVLSGLREIELWDVRAMRPAEFEQLFANTPALERLALAELTNCQDVMPVLVRHAGAFPRLHAFKLISGDLLHEDHTLADIATFIRAQPALTMLDVDLPGSNRSGLCHLLDALAEMPGLRVLGLDARCLTDQEDSALVAAALPLGLVALHMQQCWENVPFTCAEMVPLLERLVSLTRLELAHFQAAYSASQDVAEELAYALPRVRVLGLATRFWTVDRSQAPNLILRSWSLRDVALHAGETIGAAGEWLLRFHNLLEQLE